ncbi:hypothetical protein LFX25_10280 [Leptospira sp. FAT2]|uniref:hypothetical protein n=1 Tax=Leptospira sanjuanensis TaxID=2879643 RepID=UPI001EE8A10A|nr:hypothetical protein [Leptospira sanjuanensis]MCG6193628.1 hypothetical protein [Leptospira sanjuanensis]
MVNKFRFFIFLTIALCSNLEADSVWKKGFIITKSGHALFGDYQELESGYFLRQGKIGNLLPKESIQSVVDEKYREKILKSSPLKASFESLIYLRSGSEYRSIEEENIRKRNYLAFGLKFLSLGSALYFLNETVINQRRTADSIQFVNYEERTAEFLRSRENFYFSATLFLFVSLYYFVEAYRYYDTDAVGEKTGAYKAKEIPLEEYLRIISSNQSHLFQSPSPFASSYGFYYEKSFAHNF